MKKSDEEEHAEVFSKTEDGSILDRNGRVLLFSVERFVNDIGEGDCCFICGAFPGSKPFNNEHVIPDWVLAKHGLHSRRISLPNQADLAYGRYTVACCQECNYQMAQVYEEPISELIAAGYDAVRQHFLRNGPKLLFPWLALIFIKTHLKDKHLRVHLDTRMGTERIAEWYRWEELHHIHCIARSFYTGARLDATAFGSLAVLAAHGGDLPDDFDYGDQYAAKTMLLQVGEVTFITVLNDSCIASNFLSPMMRVIAGPLAPLQLREVMARLAYANLMLKTRPDFHSEFLFKGGYVIWADVPRRIEFEDPDDATFGYIFQAAAKDVIAAVPEAEREQLIDCIKSGRWSFLTDEHGKFVNHYA
jgi:hypothetical protein